LVLGTNVDLRLPVQTYVWYNSLIVNPQLPTTANAATLALAREFCDLSAHTHAANARLAELAAELDTAGAWAGEGMRSCSQWISINAGHGLHTAETLVRVGRALVNLPRINAAFGRGELSLDKARQLCGVAMPADEGIWLDLAHAASGSQLERICRAYRRAMEANDPLLSRAQLARRGLWTHWDDHGMLQVRAVLPPEDGALLLAALESFRAPDTPPVERTVDGVAAADPVRDPADDRWAAKRVDALTAACERALAAESKKGATLLPRMVVHVDVGVLTGADPDGRCHIEDGPALSAAAARRIGCDASVIAVTERDGLPIDVGRAQRIVPTPLRRALEVRDVTCCFPGCAVPARDCEAHHRVHWIDDGPTELDNLDAVCKFHHHRHHDGIFDIVRGPDGERRFVTAHGRLIEVRRQRLEEADLTPEARRARLRGGVHPDASTPGAGDAGGSYDLHYAVSVIADACAYRQSRAGPGD
jgi:hypothetical protein